MFETSRSTLVNSGEGLSMLAAMFSGRHLLNAQEDGTVFLDRDPELFSNVLQFLRTGTYVTCQFVNVLEILESQLAHAARGERL